jgi:hypothetical protein
MGARSIRAKRRCLASRIDTKGDKASGYDAADADQEVRVPYSAD